MAIRPVYVCWDISVWPKVVERPTNTHCHTWSHAASMAKVLAQKTQRGQKYENKNTTDGFHQLSNTNLDTYLAFAADSWCWRSLSLSSRHIWSVGAVAWWESEWPDIQMPKRPRYFTPVMSEAPDSLFIWTLLQRASHTERQQQQHSSLIRADRSRYAATDTEGPLLLSPEVQSWDRRWG